MSTTGKRSTTRRWPSSSTATSELGARATLPQLAAAYLRNREHLAPWDPARPRTVLHRPGPATTSAERRLACGARLFAHLRRGRGRDGDLVGRREDPEHRPRRHAGRRPRLLGRTGPRRGAAWPQPRSSSWRPRAWRSGCTGSRPGRWSRTSPAQRVLEACGFEQFGLAPKLLFLNGAWRDHVLFQTAAARPAAACSACSSAAQAGCSFSAQRRGTRPVRIPSRASGSLIANQMWPSTSRPRPSANQSCTKVAPVRQASRTRPGEEHQRAGAEQHEDRSRR